MELTPIDWFGKWCVKREDLSCFSDYDSPSGSKVRQYTAMCKKYPGLPAIVGCSADSCMQVYVAWTGFHFNRKAIVYLPARKERTSSTLYAIRKGAEVIEIRPGYPSVFRNEAKKRAKVIGGCIRWEPMLALKDVASQCENLPKDIRRVVVATGSGLVAAGVLAGLVLNKRHGVEVVAISTSGMVRPDKKSKLLDNARKLTSALDGALPKLTIINAKGSYHKPVAAVLPDGTPLDPYYAAKALPFIRDGDCFWPVGLRPVSAMPFAIQGKLRGLGCGKKWFSACPEIVSTL